MMIKAKKIKSNNPTFGIVGLSAPDAKMHPELLITGLKALRERGINIVEGSTLHTDHFYLTEKPDIIAESLHQMYCRNEVDVIMCAGGGTVMNKVLPYVDYRLLTKNPKPFVGTSNIVALMLAMLANKMVSFHSSNVMWSYGLPNRPTEYTHYNLMKVIGGYSGELPKATSWKVYREGVADGILIGGNIWTLGTVVGSKYCPVELFQDKILFLEEVAETFDKIDATITHFDNLGILKIIKGIVFGKLEECSPPEGIKMNLHDLFDLILGRYNFPVIYDCDFGHVADNLCLPLGVNAKMIAKENDPKLILIESGVI